MENLSLEEFNRVEMRVGRVVKAESIPGMKRILKVLVDLGEEERELVVGGAEFYSPEYFLGKQFIVLTNLEPKRIAGIESKGMLLAADVGGKPYWLTVDGEVPPGTRVR